MLSVPISMYLYLSDSGYQYITVMLAFLVIILLHWKSKGLDYKMIVSNYVLKVLVLKLWSSSLFLLL